MLTVQWQDLTPYLGADIPAEVEDAGLGPRFREILAISQAAYERLAAEGETGASYALCLAYRMRYVLDLNAREGMHLTELRSGREGHPSYRAVAQEMYRSIEAVHPTLAATFAHVDLTTEPRLERLLSEIRNETRSQG
jgi:thymidylate synthase ThyX